MADHRRALAPQALVTFAQALAAALRDGSKAPDDWSAAMLRDLQKRKGRCVILAGEFQPQAVHQAAREMNEALGNVGKTIDYLAAENDLSPSSLVELVTTMQRGEVDALVILGGNPAYDAPVDLAFADALARVPFSLHQSLYPNETAQLCRWHLPESHFLEAWGDVRAEDGSESIAQPLIAPLHPSRSAHELMATILEQVPTTGYEIVRSAWQQRHKADNFENFWRKTLHDGVAAAAAVANSKAPRLLTLAPQKAEPGNSLELIIRPDPHVLDGRFAENAWLQELPKPLTQLTWENAALLSPQTAKANHLKPGDVVELRYRGHSIRTPVWVLPGHADGCVTVHLGYGRTDAGPVGSGLGHNVFALQTSDAPWGGPGLEIQKTGEWRRFATTQSQQYMEGRDPVRMVTGNKPLEDEEPNPKETLYPEWKYDGPAWGMVIDLSTCIGCSACTIACQAENNIPVVGREQVLRRREMHWIRVDRYIDGDENAPRLLHQPVPCMHCENAPCELVCPVGATVHDHEGLNVMVYNRCVGTRYCSNNCPYKVRRFNFLKFNDDQSPTLKLMRNPNVTVRMRGVMEKCTYCIQRISAARIDAEKEKRRIRDGEVVPACAQACPADAIVFGDIRDPASRVSEMRQSPHHYSLLGDLNTKPRTTYLARIRNPNPEIG
jgi:molybdopterin-containing oxidoreductase family iron-sulfur binding subunit